MMNANSKIRAKFRFSVIGGLLHSVIEDGDLKKKIIRLSKTLWKDPITKQTRTFSYSTIERWYYLALKAHHEGMDTIEALGKGRSDHGVYHSLTDDNKKELTTLYLAHPLWKYQLFYEKLIERNNKNNLAVIPSYSTVRRFIGSLKKKGSDENIYKFSDIEKANRLIQHLRGALIAKSVKVYILENSNNHFCYRFKTLKNISITCHEKLYILQALEKYKKAGGTISDFCKAIEKSECTISRWAQSYKHFGLPGLLDKRCVSNYSKKKKAKFLKDKKIITKNLLEILHNQPFTYGINRSNWSSKSLAQAYYNEYGKYISESTVGRHIRNGGYSLQRAKTVLTSTDPDYREKVDILLHILQNLTYDDLFFFIDEMGPLRVKKYGGRSYVKVLFQKTNC